MYKIGLLTDVHLGYTSGRKITPEGVNVRLQDGYDAYNEVITGMINEGLDMVVIAGDLFHMAYPDVRTIVEAQKGLYRLAEAKIPVYIITGNHDATDIRSDIPANAVVNNPDLGIYSYTEPYLEQEVLPGITMHFLSHHAYTDQEKTMRGIKLNPDTMNLLISHGSAFDTNMNVVLHSPQEPREVVIPEFLMDMPWDYTWLGHIHTRGWIASTDGLTDTSGRKQYYGGSTIRRGFTDEPCKLQRGWTLWNVDTDTKECTPTMFTISQRPQIDCKPVDVSNKTPKEVEDILEQQLVDIMNTYANDDGTVDLANQPIVRQTITHLNPTMFVSLDLSKLNKYKNEFLTYTLRRVNEEIKDNSANKDDNVDEGDKAIQSKDIVSAFESWLSQDKTKKQLTKIDNSEDVIKEAKSLLKKGQDKVLENG